MHSEGGPRGRNRGWSPLPVLFYLGALALVLLLYSLSADASKSSRDTLVEVVVGLALGVLLVLGLTFGERRFTRLASARIGAGALIGVVALIGMVFASFSKSHLMLAAGFLIGLTLGLACRELPKWRRSRRTQDEGESGPILPPPPPPSM